MVLVEGSAAEQCEVIQEDHESPSWDGYGQKVNP
jgi:hypothetical protein